MNILFPYLARWKSANWSRYHQILSRLACNGNHVYVLQPPKSNMIETSFQEIDVVLPRNLHLIDLELNPIFWNADLPLNKIVKKGYYAMNCAGKIKKLVRKFHIDAILLYNIPHFFIREDSCLTIFDYADDYLDMLRKELGKFGHSTVLKFGEMLLKKMIARSDLVFSVSSTLVEMIKKWSDRVVLLPNGASRDEAKSDIRLCYQRQGDKKVVGFIGSFEYFIDFELMISAAARCPDITFLFVGGGRDHDAVVKMAEDRKCKNVVFTGPVPHRHISSYIANMDIGLNIFKKIPVSHGACPIKLFEYLIMKKPVISTRLKEIELIDQDKNLVFFADNADELARQIRFIFENRDAVENAVKRGYDLTINHYSWDSIANRFLEHLETIRSKKNVINVTTQ